MTRPRFNRILLKLSGEALMGQGQFGIDPEAVDALAREVLAARVDQWNVSPKLENGGDPRAARIVPAPLAALVATGRAYFKFVLERPDDAAEALALAAELGVENQRVLFMAQATNRDELTERAPLVAAEALARGVGYSHRLHVELWGGRRGT